MLVTWPTIILDSSNTLPHFFHREGRDFKMSYCIALGFILIFASNLRVVSGFQIPSRCGEKKFCTNRTGRSIAMPIQVLHSTSSTNAASLVSSTAKSFVSFNHPQTNTELVLIGCLHGSSSSAKDVSQLLNEKATDVVVLELCPSRYKDLTKEMIRRKSSEEGSKGSYITMVAKTIESRGLSTGIAAAVLGGVSSLSSFLSGFQPGFEFITALEFVESQDNQCDVILADRMVDETLRRVGDLPSVSLEMFQNFLDSGLDWEQTYGKEAKVLKNAVSGNGELEVDMGKTLFRSTDVVVDLARLTLPTFLFVEAINVAFGSAISALNPIATADMSMSMGSLFVHLASMTVGDWNSFAGDTAFELLSSALELFLGYMLLALPTSRVILSERDDQLTRGIDDACKFAAAKNTNGKGGRVVCVLGLLHVNGVAKNILQS